MNFFKKPDYCPLIHFAPHLLKTLELFNYSFNVFISIVSGKRGRRELFSMILCRPKDLGARSKSSTKPYSSVSVRLRSNNKTKDQINPTHKPLLPNNTTLRHHRHD
jgi:hypothetical protein